MVRVLLVAVLLVGVYFLVRWPRRPARSMQTPVLAVTAGVMVLLLLTVRGGAEMAIPLLIVLAPLLVRWLGARSVSSSPPPSGQATDSSKIPGIMDRAEAYRVLGLRPESSREEIQAAYRRLIQRVHPDRGGSSYLAARLNQARDILLESVGWK